MRERLRFDEQDDIGPEELAERRQEVMRLAQELREQARVPQQDRAQDEGIATTAAAPPPARKPLASDDEMSTAAASTPQRRKAHVGAPAVVGVFAGVIAATAIADASQSSGGWASAGAAVFVSAAFLCMLVMALVNRTAALLSPLLRPKFVVLVGAIAAAQWSFFMLYERG
ncbi:MULTISPECIES: hypothetical protein [unclassified Streptomyces]|uniref:hypothetical protein n=1 Tax=unclassified Streptomyces TaxID=2593676 RepID=UPI002DDB4BC8|nr:hypothetical protein [Streptomyces sp. NBC_00243]WRZ17009.1 hypothetical protein OHT59_00065 [Streptomyces sp. NBC_00243]WRZ25655.1 hypothetical protein OHT59_47670 [Streptomyces sp. NBC_00243]